MSVLVCAGVYVHEFICKNVRVYVSVSASMRSCVRLRERERICVYVSTYIYNTSVRACVSLDDDLPFRVTPALEQLEVDLSQSGH